MSSSGVTDNLSAGGGLILSSRLPAIGARLHLRLSVAPKKWSYLEAVVKSHARVPGLGSKNEAAFGVRFLFPANLVTEALDANVPVISVKLLTQEALRSEYELQLRLGRATATTEQMLVVAQEVLVELHLEFAKSVVRFKSIVSAIDSVMKPATIQLAFRNPREVESKLTPFLAQ